MTDSQDDDVAPSPFYGIDPLDDPWIHDRNEQMPEGPSPYPISWGKWGKDVQHDWEPSQYAWEDDAPTLPKPGWTWGPPGFGYRDLVSKAVPPPPQRAPQRSGFGSFVDYVRAHRKYKGTVEGIRAFQKDQAGRKLKDSIYFHNQPFEPKAAPIDSGKDGSPSSESDKDAGASTPASMVDGGDSDWGGGWVGSSDAGGAAGSGALGGGQASAAGGAVGTAGGTDFSGWDFESPVPADTGKDKSPGGSSPGSVGTTPAGSGGTGGASSSKKDDDQEEAVDVNPVGDEDEEEMPPPPGDPGNVSSDADEWNNTTPGHGGWHMDDSGDGGDGGGGEGPNSGKTGSGSSSGGSGGSNGGGSNWSLGHFGSSDGWDDLGHPNEDWDGTNPHAFGGILSR